MQRRLTLIVVFLSCCCFGCAVEDLPQVLPNPNVSIVTAKDEHEADSWRKSRERVRAGTLFRAVDMKYLNGAESIDRIKKSDTFQITGNFELDADIASIPPSATIVIGNAIDAKQFRVIKNTPVTLSRENQSSYSFRIDMSIDASGEYVVMLRHQGVTVLDKRLTIIP